MRLNRLALALALAAALPAIAAADDLPRRGVLGLAFEDPTPPAVPRLRAVIPGSAAEQAGLGPGTVIVSIGGESTPRIADLLHEVSALKAGRAVTVGVRDGNGERVLTLVPGPAPAETAEFATTHLGEAMVRGSDLSRDALPVEADANGIAADAAPTGTDGFRVRTLLTLPKNIDGPRPVLMFVQGLGCFSVENEAPHQPMYAPIIEALAQRGVASFRVDKPGMGDSEGGPCTDVDYETELAAYRAGLDALLADPRIDPARVYVFGHSMGGIMMPALIADRRVAGVMVYGTGFKKWVPYQIDAARRQTALEGATSTQVEAAVRNETVLATHLFEKGWSLAQVRKKFPQATANYPEGEAMFAGKPVEYFRQINARSLADEWAKVDAPVLALYGEADFVSFEDDHRAVADAVARAHPGKGTFRVLPDTDHWFRSADDFATSRQAALDGPYNPAVIDAFLDWLGVAAAGGDAAGR